MIILLVQAEKQILYLHFDAKLFFSPVYFNYFLYKTNRFRVAVRLFSNRSQITSKCGKNISDALGCASCATSLFLPHFDFICDPLLNRRTAQNLFVNQSFVHGLTGAWRAVDQSKSGGCRQKIVLRLQKRRFVIVQQDGNAVASEVLYM